MGIIGKIKSFFVKEPPPPTSPRRLTPSQKGLLEKYFKVDFKKKEETLRKIAPGFRPSPSVSRVRRTSSVEEPITTVTTSGEEATPIIVKPKPAVTEEVPTQKKIVPTTQVIPRTGAFTFTDPVTGKKTFVSSKEGIETRRELVESARERVGLAEQQGLASLGFDISDTKEISKPVGVVTKAPTTKESFFEFISDKNPFSGTLRFVGEKIQREFGSLEREFTPRGQSLAQTGAIGTGVEIAPFVIPATAPASFLLEAGGELTPSAGRGRKIIAESVQTKTGIPSGITSKAIFGTKVGLGVFGGLGVAKQVEKSLGFPKFETKFLGQQTTGSKDLLKTVQTSRTKKTGIFPSDTISASESLTKVSEEGKQILFETGTRGVSRDVFVRLPSGKTTVGKPTKFGSLSTGIAKETEQTVTVPITKGVEATKKVEGLDFIASSKTFVPKQELKKSISLGKVFSVGERKGVVVSQSAPLIRGSFEGAKLGKIERGKSFGVITQPTQEGSNILSSASGSSALKTLKSKAEIKQVSDLLTKQAIEKTIPVTKLERATETAPKVLSVVGTGKLGVPTAKQEQKAKLVQGTQLRQISQPSFLPRQAFQLGQQGRLGLGTSQITKQPTTQKQKLKLGLLQAQRLGAQQKQRSILKTAAVMRGISPRAKPVVPFGFVPFPFKFRLPKPPKGRKQKGFGFKTRRPSRTPSLLAIGRGIRSPSLGRVEFSALTLRPILTGKKKKKKKKGKGGKK